MPFSTAGLNSGADGIAAAARFISFHTADPAATGAAEVTGTGYARQQTTWAPAAGGERAGSQTTTTIPQTTTITHWGLWSAATGGVFHYGGALSAPETFGASGSMQHTPKIKVTAA